MALLELINANLRIAHKVCNSYFRDPDDRDDAFQEMMYQLWRSYPRFDGRSKFSTWMYGVCLNTALTYKRKLKENEPLSGKHEQIAEVTKDEKTDLLNAAISTLSPINKAIILLYLEEMSYDEIAGITGLTRSNVSVKIVRIKKELKDKL